MPRNAGAESTGSVTAGWLTEELVDQYIALHDQTAVAAFRNNSTSSAVPCLIMCQQGIFPSTNSWCAAPRKPVTTGRWS